MSSDSPAGSGAPSRLLAALNNSVFLYSPPPHSEDEYSGKRKVAHITSEAGPSGIQGCYKKSRTISASSNSSIGKPCYCILWSDLRFGRVTWLDAATLEQFAALIGGRNGGNGHIPVNTSGFRLNYDTETPTRAMDFGGEDQQARLADFVSKSIENLADGRSVKEAVRRLGLRECVFKPFHSQVHIDKRWVSITDLLPGMDVRLMPHQCVAVSW